MKTVQISIDLFKEIYAFFEVGEGDPEQIRHELEAKMDALINRQLYSESKAAPTAEEREKARIAYLNRKGVPEDFRAGEKELIIDFQNGRSSGKS